LEYIEAVYQLFIDLKIAYDSCRRDVLCNNLIEFVIIKNEYIKEIMGVKEKPDIIDIIEKKTLQRYGHVRRMPEDRIPKLIME
jgi:hypothetical protein